MYLRSTMDVFQSMTFLEGGDSILALFTLTDPRCVFELCEVFYVSLMHVAATADIR